MKPTHTKTGEPLYMKHDLWFWQSQSGSPVLPLWLRVAALAYGAGMRSGHVPIDRGQLGLALARVDTQTGEVVVPHRGSVSRAIADAVRFGFLGPGSNVRCLIVPPGIRCGAYGSVHVDCRRHGKKPDVTESVTKTGRM